MSLGKLAKKLRREATANPKKAAVLGILAVVSLYFWIPLVSGWMSNEDSQPAATSQTAAAAKPSSPASVVNPATKKNDLSWRLIDRWIDNDPRMMAATHISTLRDPFEIPKPEVAEAAKEAETATVKTTISPDEAGLKLTGTLIGPRGRIAQINGKNYIEGQNVEVENRETMVKAAFKLSEIRPRGVVLQSDGKRFELVLPNQERSDKIEINYR